MQLLSGKFPPDAVDDTVQHGGGAVYDTGAHTILRAFADQVFRGLKGNGRELGRPPGEGLQRDVDPRQQKAALIGPSSEMTPMVVAVPMSMVMMGAVNCSSADTASATMSAPT